MGAETEVTSTTLQELKAARERARKEYLDV